MNAQQSRKLKVFGVSVIAGCIIVYLMLFIQPSESSEANNFRLKYGWRPDKDVMPVHKFASSSLKQMISSRPTGEGAASIHIAQQLYHLGLPRVPPLDLYRDGRAVVLTATTESLPELLAQVQWLRRQDDGITIEVYLPTWEDFEPRFCVDVLPGQNVQCRVLTDIYGKSEIERVSPKAYKYLAMLASPYDSVVSYDLPSMAMVSPHHVFDSDQFNSKGLILLAGEGSSRFEAAGIDLQNCDDTQMYLAKSKQMAVMMLSAYYAAWDLTSNVPSAAAIVKSAEFEFAERIASESSVAYKLNGDIVAFHPPAELPLTAVEGRSFGSKEEVKNLLQSENDVEALICDIHRFLVCDLAMYQHKVPNAWSQTSLDTLCYDLRTRVEWLSKSS